MKFKYDKIYHFLMPIFFYCLFVSFSFLTPSGNADIPSKATLVKAIKKGDKVPLNLSVLDSKGKSHSFYNLIKGKKTVLIFYRGGWCHYCSRHLSDIKSVEKGISKLGFQIIAISADSPDYLAKTISEKGMNYRLFSDPYMKAAKAFKIVYKNGTQKKMRSKWSDGKNEGLLPVPSLFVLDDKQEIKFAYSNPKFKIRITSTALLNVLRTIY